MNENMKNFGKSIVSVAAGYCAGAVVSEAITAVLPPQVKLGAKLVHGIGTMVIGQMVYTQAAGFMLDMLSGKIIDDLTDKAIPME